MNHSSPLYRVAIALQNLFSRLTDFLARLSFWRFVGLCLLLIIAAGIAEGIFSTPSPRKTLVHITRNEHKKTPVPVPVPTLPATPIAEPDSTGSGAPSASPSDPATPAEPAPPAAAQAPAGPDDKPVEIRIGKEGVVIKGIKDVSDLETLGERIAAEIERSNDKRDNLDAMIDDAAIGVSESVSDSFSLPGFVMFLIVLMFIVRFISKSKVRAEARAVSAESAADSSALSRQLAEAKLQAMQAQVEPHFLFNTLAAVEHLIETDPPRAATMQRHLIAYLRSVLPNLRQSDSTLGREADIARNYLEILKFRMESRLEFCINIPAGLETAAMPPLMLQSLVENAIQHGLEPKPEGGRIDIAALVRDGQLVVTVADTGLGFDSAVSKRPGGGVGLTSLRERLQALFDKRGKFAIQANSPCGTRVTLEFPYAYKQATPSTDR